MTRPDNIRRGPGGPGADPPLERPDGNNPRESWRLYAACRGADVANFYSEGHDARDYAEAKAVCRRCPVQGPCLDYAMAANEQFGVWGGLAREERRRLRRARNANRRTA